MELFKLDNSKVNEIQYCMEDQNKDPVINISTGDILDCCAPEVDESSYYPLPEWTPVQGFKIMNDFVYQLKHPIIKRELTQILNSGYGVFRKFKNALKESPEIEKQWFSYKKSYMRDLISTWYNQVREYKGLEKLAEISFDDDQDLLGFDFTVISAKPEDFNIIKTLDLKGFNEVYKKYPSDVIEDLYAQKRGDISESIISEDFVFTAKTPTGDIAGFIWASAYTLGNSYDVMEIIQTYVLPDFRGLGIGKLLFNSMVKKYKECSFKELILGCRGGYSWMIDHLESEKFNLSFQELTFNKL